MSKIDSITKVMSFNKPIEVVWRAITEAKEVALWFGSAANFELREGALGYFEWEAECEGRFAMRVESVNATSYFAWRWMHHQDEPFNEANSTLVEWKLIALSDSETQLTLVESGFAALKHRAQNVEGWEEELADLTAYLT